MAARTAADSLPAGRSFVLPLTAPVRQGVPAAVDAAPLTFDDALKKMQALFTPATAGSIAPGPTVVPGLVPGTPGTWQGRTVLCQDQ